MAARHRQRAARPPADAGLDRWKREQAEAALYHIAFGSWIDTPDLATRVRLYAQRALEKIEKGPSDAGR